MARKWDKNVPGTEEYNAEGFVIAVTTESGVRKVYKKPVKPSSIGGLMPNAEGDRPASNKITPEMWNTYLEAVAAGIQASSAVKQAGFSMYTLRGRRKLDPDFVVEERAAQLIAAEPVVDALRHAAIVKGNVTAMIFYLQNRAPEEWKDMRANGRQTVAVEGSVMHVSELGTGSIERIKELIQRLEDRDASRVGIENPPVSRVIDVKSKELSAASMEWE